MSGDLRSKFASEFSFHIRVALWGHSSGIAKDISKSGSLPQAAVVLPQY